MCKNFIILLMLLGCYQKESKNFDINDYRKVEYYDTSLPYPPQYFINVKDTSIKFIRSFWDNGNLKGECYYYKGKMNGIFKIFNIDGITSMIGNYVNGKCEGNFQYFDVITNRITKSILYKNDTILKVINND